MLNHEYSDNRNWAVYKVGNETGQRRISKGWGSKAEAYAELRELYTKFRKQASSPLGSYGFSYVDLLGETQLIEIDCR